MKYEGNILVYLNEYLFTVEKFEPYKVYPKIDVEHLIPKSGRNIKAIRKDADLESLETFNKYIDLLGNKTILEAKINRELGNDWFRTKKEKYKESKYLLARTLGDSPKEMWTKDDIEAATKKACKRIIDFIFNKLTIE
ncbi:MAG: HNH endonuclease family protein [Candidatus Cloacimonetes bacterium]|nr:HNH endonuclease family protein [Candidatus Cloacimonadota bacterium]